MTKKVTVILIAVMFMMSFSFVAEAQGKGRRGDMMRHAGFGLRMAEKNLFPGRMLLKFKDEIGLTADQVTKIEKMNDLFGEAKIRRQADIKVQQMKFQTYIKKETVDRKKMEKMIRDIAKMKTDMQIDNMNYLLDVKKVLTPEQITKIEEFRNQRRKDRMNRRNSNRGKGNFRQNRF
jgi:Spy/CpxP family protein refolding chaperone